MLRCSQSLCENLPSGNYHGRIIKHYEKTNQIIVLIKDLLFRLIMEKPVKIPPGSLISFEINLGGKIQSVYKFAKKFNPKIKKTYARTMLSNRYPLNPSMNVQKLNKIIK